MELKEQLDQIRSVVPADKQESVSVVLKDIENEVIDLKASLASANSESKNRKLKLRDLEKDIEDRDIKITELDKKISSFDTSGLKKELETYKAKYSSALKVQKDSFLNAFGEIEKHPNYEPVLSKKFKVPEKKDGKPDWDILNDEDWEHNLQTFNELQELKYFDSTKEPKLPDGSKGAGFTSDGQKIPTLKEANDIVRQYGVDSPQARRALELRKQSWT